MSPITAQANKPRASHTQAHTSTARPRQDVPQSRTAQTSLHTTPPHACKTQHGARLHPPHTPPTTITPSHTRGLRFTLTTELLGRPASTGCCQRVGCCPRTTAYRTHEQPSRHTMAPDAADPSQPPATHLSASHSINQIKSNESQSAHCILSLMHNTVCERPPNGKTRQPTAVTRASDTATVARVTTRHTAIPCTCKQALGTQQQHSNGNGKQRANAASGTLAEQQRDDV
jgi:hypothetical protein